MVSLDDFKVAETRVRPSAMREVSVEVPRVKWSDVGGLEEVKQRCEGQVSVGDSCDDLSAHSAQPMSLLPTGFSPPLDS